MSKVNILQNMKFYLSSSYSKTPEIDPNINKLFQRVNIIMSSYNGTIDL